VAEFVRIRIDVDELHLRIRNVEQRVALARHLAEPPADQQHEIGRLHARDQLRIDAGAEIARVGRMRRRKQRHAAERGRDRQVERAREARVAAQAASDQRLPPRISDRPSRRPQHLLQLRHVGEAGPGLDRSAASASPTETRSISMSSGSAITTGPGRPFIAT
jgi:hypothetical protein